VATSPTVRGRKNKIGHCAKIQDQPFHVLVMLLEEPGEPLTQQELARVFLYIEFYAASLQVGGTTLFTEEGSLTPGKGKLHL
jgi:hypothetical protein